MKLSLIEILKRIQLLNNLKVVTIDPQCLVFRLTIWRVMKLIMVLKVNEKARRIICLTNKMICLCSTENLLRLVFKLQNPLLHNHENFRRKRQVIPFTASNRKTDKKFLLDNQIVQAYSLSLKMTLMKKI